MVAFEEEMGGCDINPMCTKRDGRIVDSALQFGSSNCGLPLYKSWCMAESW